MANNNNGDREDRLSALNTHEPGWVDINLGPHNVDPKPHRANATVVHQVPGLTHFDLEANAPPKKSFWRHRIKSKVVIGTAIVAILLIATVVPTVVAIRDGEGEGIRFVDRIGASPLPQSLKIIFYSTNATMESLGIPMMNSKDQSQATATSKAATTDVPGIKSNSIWKKLKQFYVAEPGFDSFDVHSFDQDAKALDDDAAKDSSLEEKAADE